MKLRYILILALISLFALPAQATVHTITNSGLTFSPATLTINLGDTVVFNLASSHNAVEVSQATWNAGGNTPLTGGFSVGFGGGTVVLTATGTYYYVCSPHASLGMKGTITVTQSTIRTNSLAASTFCEGAALTVPFTATGSFTSGNVFTAQLSDVNGSFGSPTNIGTLTGTGSGQISATLPANVVSGTGYRIRVVSSQPVVTGSDNGTDLTILDNPPSALTAAGPTTFCDGDSVTLNAATGTGWTYVWKRNGTVIGGAATASYSAKLTGSYTVDITNISCTVTTNAISVTVNPSDPTTLTWTGAIDSDWSTVGNWDNPCAIPTAGDTVVIGPGSGVPSGNAAISLARLTLNNAAGMTLGADLEITGTLVLVLGKITLAGNDLTIASSGQISGGGTQSYVVTDGSGALVQEGLGSGGRTSPVLFPVGVSASSYSPVTLTNGGTQDAFFVRVGSGVMTDGTTGPVLTSDVVDRTWFISEGTAGGSNANLMFQWDGSAELSSFDRSMCFAAHHDGSSWQPLQSPGAASATSPHQRIVTGVAAFSPFAIGDNASPLPVEYRAFTADAADGAVTLRWVTEREINSAGFAVERARTIEGSWTSLDFIAGRGSDNTGASYVYQDRPPEAGTWLYRLRQVDLDGTTEYSPVLRTTVAAPQRALAIESSWPNPIRLSAGGEVTVRFTAADDGPVALSLYNILGVRVARVYEQSVRAGRSTAVVFNAASLPAGVYTWRLEQGNRVVHQRAVIVR